MHLTNEWRIGLTVTGVGALLVVINAVGLYRAERFEPLHGASLGAALFAVVLGLGILLTRTRPTVEEGGAQPPSDGS